MFGQKFKLALAIAVSLTYLSFYPVLAQTQPSILVKQPPPAPSKPPPDNNRTSGGELSPSTCQNNSNQLKLIALVPIESDRSLTSSTHPTFWFYIPFAAEDISKATFSLSTRDSKERIYRTDFKLPKTPGIVSISLPSVPKNALAEGGEYYQWHLELSCQSDSESSPDFKVNGSIKRVAESEPQIWFDSLNRLAELRRSSPEDEKVKNDWMNLLKSVDLQELADRPIVGQVEIVNNVSGSNS